VDSKDPQTLWNKEAGPWLGEAPAGLTVRTVNEPDAAPYTAFNVPDTAEIRAAFARAFPGSPNGCYYADMPEWSRGFLDGGMSCLTPSLCETYPGRVDIIIRNPAAIRDFIIRNPAAIRDSEKSVVITPPHPELLSKPIPFEVPLILLTVVLLYFYPALFCCVGWLWIQRQRLLTPLTFVICLVLPGIFGAVFAMSWTVLLGEYDGVMTLFNIGIIAVLNIGCSLGLLTLTALLKFLKLVVRQNSRPAA
jgi:hypothetical protein